jgi:hypothetical protein
MNTRGINTRRAPRDQSVVGRRSATSRSGRWAAALCALLVITLSSCTLMPGSPSATPAAQQVVSAPPSSASSVICGTPPCDKYLPRSETRTLDKAITGHPVAAAIALHLVVSAICGGIVCLWGEGVSYVYVERQTHLAAQNGECLRVHVLPQNHAWQLVSLDRSNQSPYCTD